MKFFGVLLVVIFAFQYHSQAQGTLPNFEIVNNRGKIIISWKNGLEKPISTLSVQRSFDSLSNFITIGSVINPEVQENGFLDASPPYSAMYYRIFIVYEGGSYTFSSSKKPLDTLNLPAYSIKYNWDLNNNQDSSIAMAGMENNTIPIIESNKNSNLPILKPGEIPKPKVPAYPSPYMYTTKVENVLIHLPDAKNKFYIIKVYDYSWNPVFTLTNLKEEYLMLDKGNFPLSGWYNFELYDGTEVIEKNKFLVPKDTPKQR